MTNPISEAVRSLEFDLDASRERVTELEEQVEQLRGMLTQLEASAQSLVDAAHAVLSELQEHV